MRRNSRGHLSISNHLEAATSDIQSRFFNIEVLFSLKNLRSACVFIKHILPIMFCWYAGTLNTSITACAFVGAERQEFPPGPPHGATMIPAFDQRHGHRPFLTVRGRTPTGPVVRPNCRFYRSPNPGNDPPLRTIRGVWVDPRLDVN